MGGQRPYGKVCPALAFTWPMSDAVMVPLALTSVRKLAAVTGTPDWLLVWPMSVAVTLRLPLVSPRRKPTTIGVSARTWLALLVTLLSVTVTFWASVTPVRFTVMVL